ncbi:MULTISPECIES: YbaB/EbfC family nucleoid-associated protein [Propionispora]|uniref:Nucleoid-associated protein SAMN04490178_10532 n=2 Tax=Propionispora TaxID=112902 RepID=A0A1H8SF88_9FIRM|nr:MULTISPECIES: YbaB/EbfC family nucleoid-associated protein [Propionispora]SEO77341.1 hypothetical protein SAMN04490178_10532 [Propionispora vibrioides]SHJ75259.1 hypothetical protein SAMN02745170_03242 [Propionispora hippei DSM 15287]
MWENLGNMMDVVKKLQQNVDTIQGQLKNERLEVTSGDVIKVVINGQQEILAIELNAQYLNPESIALLQDLLVATMNNALDKSRELHQSAMNKLAGDLNLPKIPGLI